MDGSYIKGFRALRANTSVIIPVGLNYYRVIIQEAYDYIMNNTWNGFWM